MSASEQQIIRGYVQSLPEARSDRQLSNNQTVRSRPDIEKPSSGDGNGGRDEPCKVAVIADDGTEYKVLHKGEGRNLVKDINANVEVTGRLLDAPPDGSGGDEAESGVARLLMVLSYRLTDGFDDPWYDDAVG